MYGDYETGSVYGLVKVTAYFFNAGDRVSGSDEFNLWSTDVDKDEVLVKKKPDNSLHPGKYELQIPVIGFLFEYLDDNPEYGLRDEVQGAGEDYFFEGCEEYLIELAEKYRPKYKEGYTSSCAFLILWKVVYTQDYWGDHDMWHEPVGEVFMGEIANLVEKREEGGGQHDRTRNFDGQCSGDRLSGDVGVPAG